MKQQEVVSIEEWKELYKAVADFKALRCWQWMYDSDIFGVQNPEDKKIGYCCVMGMLGEYHALAVYTGTEGLDTYKKLSMGEIAPGTMSALQSQKCLMASFENLEDLLEEDLEIIRSLELEFRGDGQWPLFRNHNPGYLPWFLNASDVKFLTQALQQVVQVAQRLKKEKNLLRPKKDEEYLVRLLEDDKWTDRWIPPVNIEKQELKPIFDQTLLEELKTAKVNRKGTWQLACVQIHSAVREEQERPYYPYVALIADKVANEPIGFEVCEPAKINMKVPSLLIKTIKDENIVPVKISVIQEALLDLIRPVTEGLKIKVEVLAELPTLEPILNHVISMIMLDEETS